MNIYMDIYNYIKMNNIKATTLWQPPSPLELVQRKAFKMTIRPGHPGLMGRMTPEEL